MKNHKKPRSFRWLKNKARLSLTSGQNSVYVRHWVRQADISPSQVYRLAYSLEKMLSSPAKEFAQSARFALMIRRDYGLQTFEELVEELQEETTVA